MTKNKITILPTLIGLIALLGSFLTVTPVQADAVYGQTCNVMVYPYDPSAASDTLGAAAIPYVNQLNGTNCDSHLFYTKTSQTPNAYQPQPPPNTNDPNSGTPLANNTLGIRVPWAHHDHEYFNDKTQDANFIYKSFMDEFQITIQPDGYQNIDPSNIKCWTPVPSNYNGNASGLFNCNGSAGDLYGGTTVSTQIVGNTIVVTWRFAQNAPNIGRPQLFGNDGSIDSYINQGGNLVAQVLGLDTTNPYNRGGDFAVEILSKNNSTPVWSATTTSRAMVADLSMLKSSYNSNHQNTAYGCSDSANPGDLSNVGWCYLPRSGGYAAPSSPVISNGVDRTADFYWYTIGSVATVWKKPAPPASCTNLSVNPTSLNASGATPLTATVTTSDGLSHNATLGWTASGGNLTSPTTSGNTPGPFNNTFNLTGASGNVNVYVQSIADGVTIPSGGVCASGVQVSTPPPTTPTCTNLSLSPSTLNSSGSTALVATVTTSDGLPHSAILQWTPTGGNVTSPTTPGTTPGPFNNTFNLTGASGSVNVNVQSMPGVTIPVGGICANGISVSTTPPSNQCQNLNSSFSGSTVPGGSTTPLSANPTNTSLPNPNGITWNVTGQGELDLIGSTPGCTVPVINSGNSPVTTPTDCQYNYVTPSALGTSGTVSLDASPNNGNVAACMQTISFNNGIITPPPPPPGGGGPCTGLVPNYPTPPGNEVCVTPVPPGSGSGFYNWQVGGSSTSNHGYCQTLPLDNVQWSVQDTAYPVCQASGTPTITPPGGGGPPPGVTPPTLSKTVEPIGLAGTSVLTLASTSGPQTVQYTLTFTPTSDNTNATITDSITGGNIPGVLIPPVQGTTQDNLNYNDHLQVSPIPQCGSGGNPPTSDCYTGDIGTGGVQLVKVNANQAITITYQAQVSETNLYSYCQQTNPICEEKYPNTANASYFIVDQNGVMIPGSNGTLSASALLQSFCQYILTRASGDVYLETQLQTGKDISVCTPYKNSSNIVITPGPIPQRKLGSTGSGGTVPIGHGLCSNTNGLQLNINGQNETVYGTNAASSNISSQICEVKLAPGQSWQSSSIDSTIGENTTRVSRWSANIPEQAHYPVSDFQSLFSSIPSSTGVYHQQGIGSTRVSLDLGTGSPLVLHNGDGAKTIIVENGDLYINNDILYDSTCDKTDGTPCTIRDTASLAFIILNGNVYIDPSVKQIAGVIFVQQGKDSNGNLIDNGKLVSTGEADSPYPLIINGSVYGNIQDLFSHRQYAGDPALNGGSIVIRFDESIILNTPPGLQDVLNESQSQVAS